MDALGILQSMEAGGRNPSAFITRAVNDRLHGKVDVERRRWDQVSALAEDLRLDERAQKVVAELPATEAYRMLSSCKEKGDSVKNPSAYILKGVSIVQRDLDTAGSSR